MAVVGSDHLNRESGDTTRGDGSALATTDRAGASDSVTVRLRPLWYAPIFNVPCWLSLLMLGGPGLLRLLAPVPGQHAYTPYVLILVGLLYPAWHFYAAFSRRTFLEVSQLEFRRSICGRTWCWPWRQVDGFTVRSRGPRSGSWLTFDVRDDAFHRDPLRSGDAAPGPAAVRIDGLWTCFLFGGLEIGALAERLKGWRAWALTNPSEPPPSFDRPTLGLLSLWIPLEIALGLLICLALSCTLAAYAAGGPANVLAGLMSFAICSLLFAVTTVVTVGPARIRRHPLTRQATWIVFVLSATWLGHVAITFGR